MPTMPGSRALKERQRGAVEFVYRRFRVVALVLILATLAAMAVLPFLASSFMPDFREGHFVMQVSSSTPGTSLDEMLAMGKRVSADVLALPYVATVEQQVGRAALGEDTWGPHRSEFHVELKADTDVDQSEAEDALRTILAKYPGLQTEGGDLPGRPHQRKPDRETPTSRSRFSATSSTPWMPRQGVLWRRWAVRRA